MNAEKKQDLALTILVSVFEMITATGSTGIPSGHVYARLMADGCTMTQWEQIKAMLISTGMVTEARHVLRANAPGGAR